MVRLAIIGFGGMGRGMVRRAEKLREARFVAAVDAAPEARRQAQEEFHLAAFETVEQLLDAQVADAAYIATPNKFHAEQTVRCLEGGLHVFCEKPMAMNAQEGQAMIEAARRTGRKLTINLSYRATREAQALKRIVDSGALGHIYYARTGWMRNRGLPSKGWFTTKELSGGGPLIDLGVHRIDLAMWLMGGPEPVSASGATYDMLGKQLCAAQGRQYGVEDLAAGFVRFANGASLSVEVSWASNSQWREDMFTYLYGTKAGATHRSVGGKYEFEVRLWGPQGDSFGETVLTQLPEAPDHLEAFVKAILEDGPVPVDPQDALRVQKVLDALYESARTGREVFLRAGDSAGAHK